MNNIPRVTVTRSPGGWLVTCICKWEQIYVLRGAADRHAHDHQKICKRKP